MQVLYNYYIRQYHVNLCVYVLAPHDCSPSIFISKTSYRNVIQFRIHKYIYLTKKLILKLINNLEKLEGKHHNIGPEITKRYFKAYANIDHMMAFKNSIHLLKNQFNNVFLLCMPRNKNTFLREKIMSRGMKKDKTRWYI